VSGTPETLTPAEAAPQPVVAASAAGVGLSSTVNLLFVLPYVFLMLGLVALPVGFGAWLSFQDYDMLGGSNGFAGLDNYANLLNDRIFRGAVRNTLLFVAMTVPAFLGLGLFLALALNDGLRRSAVLRSVFFGSFVLSVTVMTLIWRLVYMPERGLLAGMLGAVGLPEVNMVADERLALLSVAIVTLWWIIGLPMTLFLAALQQIPKEIYEAAALDNASRTRTLLSITLPSMKRTILLVATIEAIMQFQIFGQVLLITGGGPNNASRPIVQFIYEVGFRDLQLGFAAAASQVLFLLMLLAALGQLWLGRRQDRG
jgi:multiple sugar transport system permease protein